MHWSHSFYFYLFLLVPFFLAFFFWIARMRKRALARFCDPGFWKVLMPSFDPRRRILKQACWLLGVMLLVITLAEPQWGYHYEEVKRRGVDLFLVVDLSNSMLAEDIKPNRLERARRKIYDFLKMAEGDRVGLIVFAGRSVMLCPLILDYQAMDPFLESLSPDLIPIQGTDLAGALRVGVGNFKDPHTAKAMIVFTDGEDYSEEMKSSLDLLQSKKISLYILGIGTPEGAPIPLPKGEGGFKKEESGAMILTKLSEKTLADLAVSTGGKYVRSVTGDEDLKELYLRGLKGSLEMSEIKSGKKQVYDTRFQWSLAFALFFFIIS